MDGKERAPWDQPCHPPSPSSADTVGEPDGAELPGAGRVLANSSLGHLQDPGAPGGACRLARRDERNAPERQIPGFQGAARVKPGRKGWAERITDPAVFGD